ncbi:MAG: hypothetical protein Q4F92_07305, partial [Acidaminococcus sp.]|uniref:hypothetical protein n=1 Tax=Acidaminococcus sp. TaxID=1872103 RepID=UPI0026E014C2
MAHFYENIFLHHYMDVTVFPGWLQKKKPLFDIHPDPDKSYSPLPCCGGNKQLFFYFLLSA